MKKGFLELKFNSADSWYNELWLRPVDDKTLGNIKKARSTYSAMEENGVDPREGTKYSFVLDNMRVSMRLFDTDDNDITDEAINHSDNREIPTFWFYKDREDLERLYDIDLDTPDEELEEYDIEEKKEMLFLESANNCTFPTEGYTIRPFVKTIKALKEGKIDRKDFLNFFFRRTLKKSSGLMAIDFYNHCDACNVTVRYPVEWDGEFDFSKVCFPSWDEMVSDKIKLFEKVHLGYETVMVDAVVYDGRMSFGHPEIDDFDENGEELLDALSYQRSEYEAVINYKDLLKKGAYDEDKDDDEFIKQRDGLHKSYNGYIDIHGNFINNEPIDSGEPFNNGIAWVKQNKKTGLIDKNGNFLIKPKTMTYHKFSDGLAWIKVGKNYGFINEAGEIVLEKLPKVGDFHDGLAWVEVNGKYGFINKSGEYVVEPKFDEVGNFIDGHAEVSIKCKYGWIDRTGELLINLDYGYIDDYSDNAVVVYNKCGSKCGLVTDTGRVIVKPKFGEIWLRDNTYALVELNGKWGVIDMEGKTVIKTKYSDLLYLGDDLFAIKTDNGWGIADKSGAIIVEPQFEYFEPFKGCERIWVKINNKWGIIDKVGNYIVKPQFERYVCDYLDYSSEYYRYIFVWSEDKVGLVNSAGAIVIEPQFEKIKDLTSDAGTYFGVKTDGKWGVMDKNCDYTVEPKFDAIDKQDFYSWLWVELDGKVGFIDYTGGCVIPIKFDGLSVVRKGLIRFNLNGKIGFGTLVNGSFKVIIEPRFDDFDNRIDDRLIAVKENGRYGLIDSDGKIIVEPKFTRIDDFSEGLAYAEM